MGCASTVASLLVIWLAALQYPQYNLISKAIGYLMGFFVGFTLNKLWTYVEQTHDGETYLLKYIMVYGVTFFVYLTTNYLCDHYIHPEIYIAPVFSAIGFKNLANWLLENATFTSAVLATGLNVVLNFLGTNFMVFKVPQPKNLFEE